MERVWGGRRLKTLYGKSLPNGIPIGESWEIVDREDTQSLVHSGPLRGRSLHDLWTTKRSEIFGSGYVSHPAPRFPILLKLLDAREPLSLQVHPPASVAQSLGGEPKTEMWYFANALPGATIHAGLKAGVTRARFESLLRAGQVAEAVPTLPVETGDSLFIPSGRLHAIGGGSVIVEVQQNSDTTYRVFDWNRTGLDGRPRTLHIEESLASTDFKDFEPSVHHQAEGVLAECPFFKLEKLSLPAVDSGIPAEQFAVIIVLSGGVTCGEINFAAGSVFLIPAPLARIALQPTSENTEVLRCTLPLI
jgi:mannose-6-phosphate isomerase